MSNSWLRQKKILVFVVFAFIIQFTASCGEEVLLIYPEAELVCAEGVDCTDATSSGAGEPDGTTILSGMPETSSLDSSMSWSSILDF